METKRKYDITIAFVAAWVAFIATIAMVLWSIASMPTSADIAYVFGYVVGAIWRSLVGMLAAIFLMLVHIAKR